MTDARRFSVSVSGAVTDGGGRLLAIQREDNGHWEPPGGMVDPGESLIEALIREVREETGLTVVPGTLSGVYQNMKRDIIAMVFSCTVASGELSTSVETTRVRWLNAEEISTLMDEAYAIRLLDALDPDEVQIRPHDGTVLHRTTRCL